MLIVDDQPPFRSVARTLVTMLPGYEVVGEAESGEDAVAQAATTHPGVVLMDINLPGINGFQATRQITDADPNVKVLLLSTYGSDDLPDDIEACGAVGYLHKEDLAPGALRAMLD